MVECVKNFTLVHVHETDEIIYVLKNQASQIFRYTVSIDGQELLSIYLGDEEPLCIEHGAENYLIVLSVSKVTERKSESSENLFEIQIRFINEM